MKKNKIINLVKKSISMEEKKIIYEKKQHFNIYKL